NPCHFVAGIYGCFLVLQTTIFANRLSHQFLISSVARATLMGCSPDKSSKVFLYVFSLRSDATIVDATSALEISPSLLSSFLSTRILPVMSLSLSLPGLIMV